MRPELRRSVAHQNCDQGINRYRFLPEYLCHVSHDSCSADRTIQPFKRSGFDKRLRKIPAACETTAATVGGRQSSLHLINPWILKNLEFLCYKIKYYRKYKSKQAECYYCYGNSKTHL